MEKIIRIGMDTIILFEKNTRTESRNRKWAKMEKSAENRQDVSFVYIRFWTKQIKYRARSDTGYHVSRLAAHLDSISASIFIGVF